MTGRTLYRRALRRRLPAAGDDRGSMAMLILVIIIGVALSGILLPIIITQTRSTRFDITRVHALDAARAGIDVTVGLFRSTAGSATYGDPGGLPCGPINGSVSGTGPAAYSVTISYYKQDPVAVPGAQKMICAPGFGPYDQATNTRTPKYALLTAVGTDGNAANGSSQGRTIVSTYVFTTDDVNIAGGIIRIFPTASGGQFCMDAGSAPALNTAILLQPCSTLNPPAAQQVFAYRSDLSIQLVSSAANGSVGLCLDSKTPHAANNPIFLNNCAPLGSAPYNQQWSVDDNAHLRATTSGRGWDSYCINIATQAGGQPLTLQTCAGNVTDTSQTWVPSPSTGAGMAGSKYYQLVNYRLFGNCLDVTSQDPTSPFLILYTCKQNPTPSAITWNQIFTPNPVLGTGPTASELVTVKSGTRYCLLSPMTVGGYVTVTSTNCPAGTPPVGSPVRWTVNQAKDSTGKDLPYDVKYTLVDAGGNCLALGPNNDLLNGQYQKAVVQPCDGSTGQKWNATPSLSSSALQNTLER
jgi:hypothetical protein